MTTEYSHFTLECTLSYGVVVRMNFSSKDRAEAAQAQISDGMSKGKYQSDEIIHVIAEGSTYDIRTAEVMSVSVNDGSVWMTFEKECREHRDAMGLPSPKL